MASLLSPRHCSVLVPASLLPAFVSQGSSGEKRPGRGWGQVEGRGGGGRAAPGQLPPAACRLPSKGAESQRAFLQSRRRGAERAQEEKVKGGGVRLNRSGQTRRQGRWPCSFQPRPNWPPAARREEGDGEGRRGHPAWVTGTLGSETSITTGGPKRSPRPDNQDPKRRPKPKGASLSSLVPWISAQAQGIQPGLQLPGSFFPLPPTLLSCHLV